MHRNDAYFRAVSLLDYVGAVSIGCVWRATVPPRLAAGRQGTRAVPAAKHAALALGVGPPTAKHPK